MAKLISLNDYIRKKNTKKEPPPIQPSPIGFSNISLRIMALAQKDQETIYKNIKYNYYNQYVEYIQLKGKIDQEYGFHNYIRDHLNLRQPFEILHGVDFSGGTSFKRLSDNDWGNIADMVVRLSLIYALDGFEEIDLLPLAAQYDWDYVLFDAEIK